MTLPAPRGRSIKADIDATAPPANAIALWYLGQSGFVVKAGGTVLYLDPYLSDFLETYTTGRPDHDPRRFTPPLRPDEIDNADFVFGSHWHYDHIDPPTMKAAAERRAGARLIVPRCARKALVELGIPAGRFADVETDVETRLGELSFTAIPSAHETLERDPACGYPYWGYLIAVNGVAIYHSGDCIPYDGLLERLRKRVDVAMLPINGRDYFRLARGFAGNFTYREAADLADAIGADLLVPMHVGMHMANTERPGALSDYLADRYPYQKCHFMTPGEKVLYHGGAGEHALAFCGRG
jgi:L-ascorbate 6-phosphate lactonase